MKLWKKVSAMVAMVAMCVTLAVPVTASAETIERIGGCARHGWSDVQIRDGDVVATDFHTLADGSYCQIDTVEVFQYQYCNDCGIQQTIGYTYGKRHRNVKCEEAE